MYQIVLCAKICAKQTTLEQLYVRKCQTRLKTLKIETQDEIYRIGL